MRSDAPRPLVPVYYRPEYVLAAHAFDTTRKAAWVAESLADAPIEGLELRAPRPLADAELFEVHTPGYVEAVRTGVPRELAESQGFSWDPSLWDMVCASNGGAVAAALSALDRRVGERLPAGRHAAPRRDRARRGSSRRAGQPSRGQRVVNTVRRSSDVTLMAPPCDRASWLAM